MAQHAEQALSAPWQIPFLAGKNLSGTATREELEFPFEGRKLTSVIQEWGIQARIRANEFIEFIRKFEAIIAEPAIRVTEG